MPGSIRLSLGGASSVPFFTTKMLLATPSVMNAPSVMGSGVMDSGRIRMVSAQPASTAIWRSSTLGSSAMALMSQRSQRLSGAVMQEMPLRSNSAGGVSSGLLIMNTVGLTGGLGKA